jgi:hypothetical protein
MLKRQQWTSRVRHFVAIALAVAASLALRSGWAQQQPPASVDHSQHAPGQHPPEHAGHGDHPPAKATPKAKSKAPAKKQTPAGHKGSKRWRTNESSTRTTLDCSAGTKSSARKPDLRLSHFADFV